MKRDNIFATVLIGISCLINFAIVTFFKLECPWKSGLGIDCAGCGGTRMFFSILELDFYQAFRFNPLIFSLLIIATVYMIYVICCILLKKKYYKLGSKTLVAVLIMIVGFTILRNIKGFEFLKPTYVR